MAVVISSLSTNCKADVLGECTLSDVSERFVRSPAFDVLGHLAWRSVSTGRSRVRVDSQVVARFATFQFVVVPVLIICLK